MVLFRGWGRSRWCECPVCTTKGIWCELPSALQGNKCIMSWAAARVLKVSSELSKGGISIVLPLFSGNLPQAMEPFRPPLLRWSKMCASMASLSVCELWVILETLLSQFFSSGETLSHILDPLPHGKALCSFTFKSIFVGVELLYNVALVSAVQQSESAIRIHVSLPFWILGLHQPLSRVHCAV